MKIKNKFRTQIEVLEGKKLMDGVVNSIFRFLLPSQISLKTEKLLKNTALLLGLLSAVAIIFDWYPLTMFLSFPFCLIWIYCAWLRTEPQLKWVNLIFLLIYSYGIGRYFLGISAWDQIWIMSNLKLTKYLHSENKEQ